MSSKRQKRQKAAEAMEEEVPAENTSAKTNARNNKKNQKKAKDYEEDDVEVDEDGGDEDAGADDAGEADENKGGENSDEDKEDQKGPKGVSKKEQKKLKKGLKKGTISFDEFEKQSGRAVAKVQLTEEEQRQALKDQEKESLVTGLKERKGIVDSFAKDIIVEQFSLAYKQTTLLRDTDLKVAHGRKYGLIAPNGAGKSTLLRHISQRHLPIPHHINILHVEQEFEATDKTALEAVLEADEERMNLLKEEEELKTKLEHPEEGEKASDRLVEKRLKAIGAYSAQARAAAILSGLQFTTTMQLKKTREFSGGWRMRISLARALFVQPDLLLLDEPTNHLDLDAVIWLECYLRKYKKTLLLCSHDRDFLNGIITDIIVIKDQKLVYFKGNYDSYETGSSQQEAMLQKKRKKEQKLLDEAQEKQTASTKKKKQLLEKKGVTEKAGKEYSVKFIFKDPGQLTPPVIQIKNAGFAYPGQSNIFEGLELNVDCESRIAIVGPNGAGKSTFMNLILGELQATSGEIVRNRHLRVAKFSQHFVDQLTMTDTPVHYIMKKFPEMKEQDVRNKLGMFNLKGNLHNQPISLLSGGQKSRVALAEIGLKTPHIFFLDEPTNHLDIQSVDALSEALQAFPGGVILITHDQRLVSTVAKELWVCRGDKHVEIYRKTFDDYKQEIIDRMPDELFLEDEDE